jgi:hypothetical protein
MSQQFADSLSKFCVSEWFLKKNDVPIRFAIFTGY